MCFVELTLSTEGVLNVMQSPSKTKVPSAISATHQNCKQNSVVVRKGVIPWRVLSKEGGCNLICQSQIWPCPQDLRRFRGVDQGCKGTCRLHLSLPHRHPHVLSTCLVWSCPLALVGSQSFVAAPRMNSLLPRPIMPLPSPLLMRLVKILINNVFRLRKPGPVDQRAKLLNAVWLMELRLGIGASNSC
jgi:hypothetical protein